MFNQMLDDFFNGQSIYAHQLFGSFVEDNGVRFRVYAPEAQCVKVMGDFNGWDADCHWLDKVDYRGVWEVFVEGATQGQLYKYVIQSKYGEWFEKADPYARYNQLRPDWANIIIKDDNFKWEDKEWLKKREINFDKPMNIYEVHCAGWKRDEIGNWYTYDRLADELIPYVKEHGYTHIELMPLMNHPFDGSWGYQITGFFSLTSRYGTIEQFKYFVNEAHKAGIGVIMDYVTVHFAPDGFALRNFDGSAVYEYSDSNEKSQWGSYNFDLGKDPVRSFLMSAGNYWVENFHLDGLRMDAVSNMVYWEGNKNKGRNEGALEFIRRFNTKVSENNHNIMMIAEDSTDFPKVTEKIENGGLGFHYKWDLGWMNDTLSYYKKDPVFRRFHHNTLTFSMMYFYSEKFILPLSHDEVVHGKATIVNKMWGLYEDKFAQARNLNVYMMSHPGKKLNFMGNEIGHFREFDEAKEIDWFLLQYPMHDAFLKSVTDLNKIYLENEAFWKEDYTYDGFKWIDADNSDYSVFSYYRQYGNDCFVFVLNMTPNDREDFIVGVPEAGFYKEIYNTDKGEYGGQNRINEKSLRSFKQEFKEYKNCIKFRLAPFAGIIFHHKVK